MDRLYEKLVSYSNKDYYPMHMPGHKRNSEWMQMMNPYEIDITEIEGFDNLHQAEGVLKNLADRISRLYGAGRSYPLVNGSTAGILAGISAATNKGDRVIIARNCHKSVYHGVILRELKPVYLYPQCITDIPVNGGILPEELEQLLITHPDIRLVVITSPTYEGVVSDVRTLADIAHRYGAILLVDEAHGAHFGFDDRFPQSSVTLGADIVIHSIHKTLPAFTQTAVLHSNRPDLNLRIEQYLAIFQSSSPSYVLLSGLDCCIRLLEDRAKFFFDSYDQKLQLFYQSMNGLQHLKVLDKTIKSQPGVYDLDPSKITVSTLETAITGHELKDILREQYHIIMEMDAKDYVLGMTSICDTWEGIHRFEKALLEIDSNLVITSGKKLKSNSGNSVGNPKQTIFPYEAKELQTELISVNKSAGRVSAGFVSLFPPGSPLLIPGEFIEEKLIVYITWMKEAGLTVTGLSGENKDRIEVIRET